MVRLLLIAALLLQGFVLALGSGAVASAPAMPAAMPGCGCASAAQDPGCCPSTADADAAGCGASLGAALCACTAESPLPARPLEAPPVREAGPERTISACAAAIAPRPASPETNVEPVAHAAAPHVARSHQQVRALLGTWRS